MNYNIESFTDKVNTLLADQDSYLSSSILLHIIQQDIAYLKKIGIKFLMFVKNMLKGGNKKITLLVDIAYIDYAGEKMNVANS